MVESVIEFPGYSQKIYRDLQIWPIWSANFFAFQVWVVNWLTIIQNDNDSAKKKPFHHFCHIDRIDRAIVHSSVHYGWISYRVSRLLTKHLPGLANMATLVGQFSCPSGVGGELVDNNSEWQWFCKKKHSIISATLTESIESNSNSSVHYGWISYRVFRLLTNNLPGLANMANLVGQFSCPSGMRAER